MKDYKKILEGVVNIINTTEKSDIGFANICSYIGENFPELKESEDERIRNWLIETIKQVPNDSIEWETIDKSSVLAWLEKQCEQNPAIEMKTPEESLGIDSDTYNKIVDECIYGEQKPAEEYSFNIESELFHQLIQAQQVLWRKEIEQAYNAGADTQKPAWSEEDENKPNGGIVMEDFNDGNGFYKVNLAYLNEEQVEEIEELVKRWNLQPKGDEDESIVSDLLDYFDNDKCLKHEVNDVVKWLKTIKPQQKGWGENEIKMLDNLITYLDGRKDLLEEIKETYIDWLKSLSPQSHWKPSDGLDEASYRVGVKRVLENPESYGLTKNNWKQSDEQMEALSNALSLAKNCGEENAFDLRTLFEQLKKLKE